MFKLIRRYINRLKTEHNRREYHAGYSYAAGELLLTRNTEIDTEGRSEMFKYGVCCAIDDWRFL